MNDEDKKHMKTALCSMLSLFSNKEHQKKAWVRGEEADFDEAICLFFDIGDPILEKHKSYGISRSQKTGLLKFREAFDRFIDSPISKFPEKFIDSPEWDRITNMAKEVLNAFEYRGEQK